MNINSHQKNIEIRDYSRQDYREFWRGPSKSILQKAENKIIRELLPSTPGWFVEVGAGYGRLIPTYFRSDRKVVLVDYATNLLEIAAQTHHHENIHFVAANAYYLPFRNDVFRSGLSVRTFHHMKSPRAFLHELARILRPGEEALINYANKRNVFRIFKHGLRSLHHDHEPYKEMLFGTHPAYFIELSAQEGLYIQRTRGTGFFIQIVNAAGFLDHFLEKMPFLTLPVSICEAMADRSLGRLGFAPFNFALLRKDEGARIPSPRAGEEPELVDILACPRCRSRSLVDHKTGFTCSDCKTTFPRKGKILDFRCEWNSGP